MVTGIGNAADEHMSDGQSQLLRETYLSPMRDGNNFEERMKLAVYHTTIVYVKGHGERSVPRGDANVHASAFQHMIFLNTAERGNTLFPRFHHKFS